jgi:hypothetical protein
MFNPLFRGSTKPLALIVCLLSSFTAWSQSYQGGLRGMVMDGGGAVIGTAKLLSPTQPLEFPALRFPTKRVSMCSTRLNQPRTC